MWSMKSTMTLHESLNISPINDRFISYFGLLEYRGNSINYIYPETPLFEEYKHMNYLEYREFMRNYRINVENQRYKFLESKYGL